MPPEWILFDADGVLQSTRDGWLEQLSAAGGDRPREFVLAVFEAELSTIAGGDFGAAMARVLAEHGIDRPLHDVLDRDYWIVVDPAMLAAVQRLREVGIRCALTTNQQNLRGGYMRASLGYDALFDAVFYSYELGVAKPDPRYFERVLDRIGVAGASALLLDDNADNVAGARSCGLQAELFPRDGGLPALRRLLGPYGVAV